VGYFGFLNTLKVVHDQPLGRRPHQGHSLI
jgi:hypothetical protein